MASSSPVQLHPHSHHLFHRRFQSERIPSHTTIHAIYKYNLHNFSSVSLSARQMAYYIKRGMPSIHKGITSTNKLLRLLLLFCVRIFSIYFNAAAVCCYRYRCRAVPGIPVVHFGFVESIGPCSWNGGGPKCIFV